MRSVRDTYDVPKRPPLPLRQLAVMAIAPLAALALWLAVPDSPVTVALLAITFLGAVFMAVAKVLRSRELDETPGRNPVTPPSAENG
jgi:4-hydroxybenzoate polyprenyltransferase